MTNMTNIFQFYHIFLTYLTRITKKKKEKKIQEKRKILSILYVSENQQPAYQVMLIINVRNTCCLLIHHLSSEVKKRNN